MSYPILYQAGETNFNHLGLGILKDTISAVVSEDLNGKFELDLVYAYNNRLSKSLVSGNIIKVDAGNTLKEQLFTIAQVSKTLDGKASVHAEHVSYIMQDLTLKPKTVVYQQDAQNALKQLLNAIKETDHGFTVVSDISTISSSTWSVPDFKTPRDVLAGVDGSILDNWGGEYRFDNRRISLLKQRGSYANTVIAYGRNLLDFDQETSILETYTSIYPVVVKTEKDVEVTHTLPELVVDSQYLDKYANRKSLLVDFSDKFDDKNPYSDDKLRALATTYIRVNKVGIPKVTMTIKTLDLSKMVTDDYKAGRVERLDLADIVKVYFDRLGITTEAKVVGIKWNVLKESYDEYVLGERKANFGTVIRGSISEVKSVANSAKKNAITALISADSKNTNYYGNSSDGEPQNPKKGDIWFVKDGDKTIIKTWNGSSWVDLVSSDWQEIFNAKLTEELSKSKVELDAALAEKDAALAELDVKLAENVKILDQTKIDLNQTKIDVNAALLEKDIALAGLDEKIADELVVIDNSIVQAQTEATEAKTAAQDAVDKANANVQAIEANTQLITDVNAIANNAKTQAQTAATNAQTAVANAGTAMNNSQAAITDAQAALDAYNNLEIGGRNLIPGTSEEWESRSVAINLFATNIYGLVDLSDYGLKAGDTITLSMELRTSNTQVGLRARFEAFLDNNNRNPSVGNKIVNGEGVSTITATIGEDRPQFRIMVQSDPAPAPQAVSFDIRKLKLEKGNQATDWTPAPEDVQIQITNINGELSQKVSQNTFDTLQGTVSSQNTQINQNKSDIASKANQTTVNTLTGRVSTAETNINQNAKEIVLKANKTAVDSLTGRVSTAESSITQNANDIKLKANQTDVNTIGGKVSSLESSLTVQSGQITALNTKTDGQTTKIGSLQSSYDGLTSTVASVENSLEQNNLVYNSTLQSGSDGWTLQNGFTQSSARNINGNYIINFSLSDNPSGTWYFARSKKVPIGMWKGYSYAANFMRRTDIPNNGVFAFGVEGFDANGNRVEFKSVNIHSQLTTDDWWVKLSDMYEFTNPDVRTVCFVISTNGYGHYIVCQSIMVNSGTVGNFVPDGMDKGQITQMVQDLDGFKTTVANTYADKNTVASQINQSATQVTQNVQSWTNGKLNSYSTIQSTDSSIASAVASKADKSQVTQLSNQITSTVTGSTNETLISTQMISSTTLKNQTYPGMPMVEVNVTSGESYTVSSNLPNDGTATAPIANVWFLRSPSTVPISNINGVYDGKSITLPALSDKIYIVFSSQSSADMFISGKYWVKVEKTPASQSQITQLATDINLRVSKDDIVNQINISPESILIAGNKVQITGQTYIENGVISSAKISDLSASKLIAGTIDASVIVVDNINANRITVGILSADRIGANTITADKIQVANLASLSANLGTITAGFIDASKVVVDNINANRITVGTLSADRIAANSITATHISVSSLSALSANLGVITAGTINAATVNIININAGSITTGVLSADRIGANSITADKINATSLDLFSNDSYTNIKNDGMRIQSKAQIVFANWRDSNGVLRSTQGLYVGGTGSGTKHVSFTRSDGSTFMLRANSDMDYGSNTNVATNALNIYDYTHFWTHTRTHGNIITDGYYAMGGGVAEASIQYGKDNGTMNFRVPGGRSGSYFWFNQRAISEGSFDSKSKLSLKNVKGNYQGNALDDIVNTNIVEYSYKNDPQRRQLSPIIDDINEIKKYHLPDIINDGESVNLYAMGSLSWLAIKQLAQKLENIEEKLDAIA